MSNFSSNFIKSEIEHFSRIIDSQVSVDLLERFRKETVAERQLRVSKQAYEICGGTVKYGPFKGLKLTNETWWGGLDLGSQCFGLYEKEILDILGAAPTSTEKVFVDIGAADGYYAIGMLHSGKAGKAICFEQSEHGRTTISKNFELNSSPGSLAVLGEASPSSLLNLSTEDLGNALVIIDIEGAEFDLLVPEVLHFLKHCTVIIEIHHWIENFLNKYERFLVEANKYFSIEIIKPVERFTSTIPELEQFTDVNRLLLTAEGRPCLMRFLQLSPRELFYAR